jgi:tetratricopeptide (TPR) repeat protein
MTRRASIAAAAALLACGGLRASAHAGQSPLADAQYDYNAGRYNRAVDSLNAALLKSPNDPSMYFLLGECYYELREFQRAVASLERAVQLSPKDSQFHDWLGRSYGRKAEEGVFLGAMSLARKSHREFEVAVELDPHNLEAQRDLIRFEMNAPSVAGGGDDKAQKHIDALEKIDPIEAELARGEFFTTKKRIPEADTAFVKILASDADRAGVFFEVADYFRDRSNADKMAEAVDRAARIDSDDRRLKFYQGSLLVIQKKSPAEAETLLKSYLATVPDNSDLPPHSAAKEWLGKLYESQGRYSEAAEEYRASLVLDPHNKVVEEELRRVERK